MNNHQSPIGTVGASWDEGKAAASRDLCQAFLDSPPSQRFILGRNVYTDAVVKLIDVAGIVDDYSEASELGGLRVFRTEQLPSDAFVLAAAGGRPLTVRRKLGQRGLRQIDYFAFQRWSGLDLPQAVFNENFATIFEAHRAQVEWLHGLLADQESREVLLRLLSFRASHDLDFLEGFVERQNEQYFEDFLDLRHGAPVFLDVGGFDGATSEEFIRRVPDYRAVHVFEPEPSNLATCKTRLAGHRDVTVWPFGAGDENVTLRFSAQGSASRFCDDGEVELQVRRLDDIVDVAPTFVKMDIEGAEISALRGAEQMIRRHKPTLAVCVYHKPSDFWEVPGIILSMNQGYRVYLRHYTESIYETVMYFVPDGNV